MPWVGMRKIDGRGEGAMKGWKTRRTNERKRATEITRLRAQRDQLREALKLAREYVVCGFSISQQIDAAVAAAEEKP